MKSGPEGPGNLGRTTQGAFRERGMWLLPGATKMSGSTGVRVRRAGFSVASDDGSQPMTTTPSTTHSSPQTTTQPEPQPDPSALDVLDALTDWAETERRALKPDATTAEKVIALRRCGGAARRRLVRHFIATGDLEAEVFAQMAVDPLSEIRVMLARYASIPLEIMEILSRDRSFMVRGYLASHPECPPSVYRRLLTDPVDDVRIEIAQRDLPPDDVERLVNDPSSQVRRWVAERDDLTPDQIRRLADDASPLVPR